MPPGYTLLAVKQPDVGANPCAARAYRLRKWPGIAGSALPSPTWGRYRLGAAGRTAFGCGSGHGAENDGSPLSVAPRYSHVRSQERLYAFSNDSGTNVRLPLAREQATYSLLRVSGLIVRKLPACHAFTFPGFRATHTSP